MPKREQKAATAAPDLLAEAFVLIAERGWAGLTMADLAARAGVPLVEVYRRLPSRAALLAELGRRADEAMLGAEEDPEFAALPPRDRAFEAIMRRFDALGPFKPGLRALARGGGAGGGGRTDPVVWLVSACNLDRAATWLREAAGLRRGTLRGAIAKRALALAYVRTVRAWLDDDSPDLARTMAELDGNLRRIERVAGLRAAGAATTGAPDGTAAAPAV